MQRECFHSDDLGPSLDDAGRFALWYEALEAQTCCVDITRFEDRPFSALLHSAVVEGIQVTHFAGSFGRVKRSRSAISRGPDDDLCLVFHRGGGRLQVHQAGRETHLDQGGVFLGANGLPADMHSDAAFAWTTLTIARDRLATLIGAPEDLVARPIDALRPAAGHLRRTIENVLELPAGPPDAELDAHIGRTLVDLTALVLGARGDAARLAATRGLRAARISDIMAEIDRGFRHPGFSADLVARRVGLSTRYIQDLLQETGLSFTEHLLERRLRQAWRTLSSEAGDRLKISEIALACGFSEVSYFNQRFRRRYGMSPSDCRRAVPR